MNDDPEKHLQYKSVIWKTVLTSTRGQTTTGHSTLGPAKKLLPREKFCLFQVKQRVNVIHYNMKVVIENFLDYVDSKDLKTATTIQNVETKLNGQNSAVLSIQDRQRGELILLILNRRYEQLQRLRFELEELQILYSDNLQQLNQTARLRIQNRDLQRLLRLCLDELMSK